MRRGPDVAAIAAAPAAGATEAGARSTLAGALATLLVVVLVAAAGLLGLFKPLDNWLTDWRFTLASRSPTGQLVFVEIDPASLRQVGVWPWPRHVYADLIDHLMALGVADTVLDVDFSSASSEADDKALEGALRRAGGYAELVAFRQFSPVTDRLEVTLPLKRFLAAGGAVVVNVVAEQDGVVRRYPAGMQDGDKYYPSLAEALSGETLRPGEQVYLDYGIDASAIDRISVGDILDGKVDAARLAGKQVVVGASAQELRDLFTVPRFGTLPGGLLQVIAAETLKQHRALRSTGLALPLAAVLLLGLAFFALRGRVPLWLEASAGVAAVVLIESAGFLLQADAGILLRTAPADAALFGFLASAVLQELRNKRRLHAAAARERDAMRLILDRVIADNFDGVVVIDDHGEVIIASHMAEKLLGDGASLVGRRAAAVLPEGIVHALSRELEEGAAQQAPAAPAELTLGDADARRTLEYVVTRSEIAGREGAVNRVVCLTFRDISERRRSGERLAFLARHDALTGALSRLPFVETIEQALTADADRDQGLTVVIVDLGRFRVVNDMLGHSYGDRVMKEVVRRLESLGLFAVGRVGGDSFAVARRGRLDAAAAMRFAEAINAEIVKPYSFEGRRAVLSAHAGVTTSDISGFDGDVLLSHADMALSAIKSTPGSAVEVFVPAMNDALLARQEMEAALRQAIAEEQFEVHYQPQITLATGALCGVEALLRWRHPTLGNMSPANFIPIAEETGLIVELGRVALNTACRDLADWPESVRLAVNISPMQFELDDMVHEVRTALTLSGLPARRLDIEITEGLFVGTNHPVNLALERLRQFGVGVALDDFGTGYSSLSYLGRLPIDTLKIDRSFVSGLPDDPEGLAIVNAVLTLSRTLGKVTVAEGIETAEQAQLLQQLGCRIGQGWYFAKALPIAGLTARYRAPPAVRRAS